MNYIETKNIEYLKKNGVVSYHLLTSVFPESICWMAIQVTTTLDGPGSCSVRIDVNFMDEYKDGTIAGDRLTAECETLNLIIIRINVLYLKFINAS
jgi:hypothetical protein